MSDNSDEDASVRVEDNVYNIQKKGVLVHNGEMDCTLRNYIHNIMPIEWFDIHTLGDENFDSGRGHIMIERIAGPAVGSFHLWRQQGYIHVRTLIEADITAEEATWPERFRHITGAVKAIARAISIQLQAWTLLLRRNQGRG